MNIEKWIEENSELVDNCFSGERLIHPDLLRELLKTHAIVPREPGPEIKEIMLTNQSNIFSAQGGIYRKIIKSAESEP